MVAEAGSAVTFRKQKVAEARGGDGGGHDSPRLDNSNSKMLKFRETVSTLEQLPSIQPGGSDSQPLHAPTQEEDASVCLAWYLAKNAHAVVTADQLKRLHAHIAMCIDLVSAQILLDGTTLGLIRGPSRQRDVTFSEADAMVRLGQLLCRWAAKENLDLRVGVHAGHVETVHLATFEAFTSVRRTSGTSAASDAVTIPAANGEKAQAAVRAGYFGSAIMDALDLALVGRPYMVCLSHEVKQRLRAFRLVRLVVAPSQQAYFLDRTTSLTQYELALQDRGESNLVTVLTSNLEHSVEQKGNNTLSLEDFETFLWEHDVDVSKFGRGAAKSLEQFYDGVVSGAAELQVVSGSLERVVHIARIYLRARESGAIHELRLKSESTQDGAVRFRDQLLAFTLSSSCTQQWVDSVRQGFADQFNIPKDLQDDCMDMDMQTYSYKEERTPSPSTPGITTTYKVHAVSIQIREQHNSRLNAIGLPGVNPFTTDNGPRQMSWTWLKMSPHNMDELVSLLRRHQIDVEDFAPSKMSELYDEVYERKLGQLEEIGGELRRKIQIIRVYIRAYILNVEHVLLVKAKWQKGAFNTSSKGQPITMRMTSGSDWEDATRQAVLTRLNLSLGFQERYLAIDLGTHDITEEIAESPSYGGLRTVYTVHEVIVRVRRSGVEDCDVIGLPLGTDFTTGRHESLSGTDDSVEAVVTHWRWEHAEEHEGHSHTETIQVSDEAGSPQKKIMEKSRTKVLQFGPHFGSLSPKHKPSEEALARRRVPQPKALKFTEGKLSENLMQGKVTDWQSARNAAGKIREASYSCKDFYNDLMAAFPELRLYCISTGNTLEDISSSGRSVDDEYQRTIGALFAVYWLMRLDMDGKQAFSFGLDERWEPRNASSEIWSFREDSELTKRTEFFENTDWATVQQLVVDSGCLLPKGDAYEHDVERTLAMLVTMTIHDIMKLKMLLPQVADDIPDFSGYKSGETITDHDIALGYILAHQPSKLPSFVGLPTAQKDSIRFALGKMEYNMGWLVQGEAPPGALFTKFREVVTSGQANQADIAFYFFHWFVDLAGAEPAPLEGCEKFVLRFPLRVLTQFLDSFKVVQTLSLRTEAELYEEYLTENWVRSRPQPSAPSAPSGPGAIAKMRIALMAQGNSEQILSQFDQLPQEDKVALSEEMAITGCRGQQYVVDSLEGGPAHGKGPAILVYYGPALLQKLGSRFPRLALRVLAEVYRVARELWPLTVEAADENVFVYIDALKEMEAFSLVRLPRRSCFLMVRNSHKDGLVKLDTLSALPTTDWRCSRMLAFDQDEVLG